MNSASTRTRQNPPVLSVARSIMLATLLLTAAAADARVSVSIGIGFNVPAYPQLVLVPGYPVYYAPQAGVNLFFYDGLYWVYSNDNWYQSAWYDGPWDAVEPAFVPLFVLRVPVRYYRQPPPYFRGWRADAPPRWGEHWGPGWQQSHPDWDRWNRRAAPAAAPLPTYQRDYRGDRYPRNAEQQRTIRSEHYRFQPKDAATQQRWQQNTRPNVQPNMQRSPQVQSPQRGPAMRDQRQQGAPQQAAPQERGRGNKGQGAERGRGKQDEDRGGDERH